MTNELIAFAVGTAATLLVVVVVRYIEKRRRRSGSNLPAEASEGPSLVPVDRHAVPASTTVLEKATSVTITHSDASIPALVFERDDSSPSLAMAKGVDVAAFQQVIPVVVTNALVASGVMGTYRATTSAANLLRYSDGSVSSVVRGASGKITSHSGFVPTKAVSVFGPIIAYQLLSIITGQYYLHGIARQLSDIASQVQKLVTYHHNDRAARLQSYCQALIDLLGRSTITLEDAVVSRSMAIEIESIEREYSSLIRATDERRYDEALDKGFLSSNPKLESIESHVNHDSTYTYMQLLLMSRRAKFLAMITDLKVNGELSKSDPSRVTRTNEILRAVLDRSQSTKADAELARCDAILGEAARVARAIHKQAWRASTRARASQLERTTRRNQQELMSLRERNKKEAADVLNVLEQRMSDVTDVYLVADSGGVRLIPATCRSDLRRL